LKKEQADHQAKTPDNDQPDEPKKFSDSIRDTASHNYHHPFDFELKHKVV
jgi:hypothetical protein